MMYDNENLNYIRRKRLCGFFLSDLLIEEQQYKSTSVRKKGRDLNKHSATAVSTKQAQGHTHKYVSIYIYIYIHSSGTFISSLTSSLTGYNILVVEQR